MNLLTPAIISSRNREIYLISDTHFNHANIISYCGRPFRNEEMMDEIMVEKWNSVVRDQDIVYHLGDVYMGGKREYISSLLRSLKGRKRLILGNHDNGKDQLLHNNFQKISMWRMFPEFGLLLTHIPVHQSSLKENPLQSGKYDLLNIHGHIHQNQSPTVNHQCVCVEQINYTPINIEELRIR